MVVYENIGQGLVKAYSDEGLYIHGGFPENDYTEAIDPVTANRTYIETETPIETATTEEKAEAYDLITEGE